MNFNLPRKEITFLSLLTVSIGLMQVLTPVLLRTLIDGILPSKDGKAIASVLIIIGLNELLLIAGNSFLNKELDEVEKNKTEELRNWMLDESSKLTNKIKDPEAFYQVWGQDTKKLIYKKFKNRWFRVKDLIVLCLLTIICLNISYLAGFLILFIAGLSFTMVTYFQKRQGADIKEYYSLLPKEKECFDDFIGKEAGLDAKPRKLRALKEIGTIINELQFSVSRERTRSQDINSVIRFCLMFSILGVGGYLFANEKLSMGSLWALLITMYRITPTLQNLIRWILQSKSDENLEERVFESLKTKVSFKKPAYYNRLVKILEKSIQEPSQRVVRMEQTLNEQELKNSLFLWLSFYSKKDDIVLVETQPEVWQDDKLYFAVRELGVPLPKTFIFFCGKDYILPEDLKELEVTKLDNSN